jgi:hypothetical protein
MIEITSEYMTLSTDGEVIETARFNKDAAADGNGAWIVSTHPLRLFYRDQAITALTLAERLAAGFGNDDPFVKTWRKELFL